MSRRLDPDNFTAEKLAWHQLVSATPGLSLPAKAVAGLILHDLNPLQGGAWRGQDSMSELLGVSERQLRRLLSELQAAGFLDIEIQKGRGRTNRYFATVPTGIELFRPKASECTEKAPETRTEKRTSASSYPAKNRTPMTKKPDMDGRQYLYKPIKDSRASLRPSPKLTPVAACFPNPDIRREVLALIGPEKTASYLDSAIWDSVSRMIITPHAYGADRLREFAGRYLARENIGVSFGISEQSRQVA
ncbi:hypothetical protein WEU32_04155 [Brevundimonas sp. BH3]|uniref:hypothetical protein n=1 Tax=Brevundimonas sp. BH3 TaxID=3133089 RepID=UPI00324FBF62